MKSVTIVGATGLVGRTVLSILEERSYPVQRLNLFASDRAKGVTLDFRGEPVPVTPLAEWSGDDSQIAFFCAGGEVSINFAQRFATNGTLVIDNSSTFRMDPNVPLIVPEVNRHEIPNAKGIIANPNCSTIQLVVALAPLHRHFGVRRAVVSTYQSVSGKGFKGVKELESQRTGSGEPHVFPYRIEDNLIPFIDEIGEDGYCLEETKLMRETKKILHDDGLAITATSVRVPVSYCHSESVNLEFETDIDLHKLEEILQQSPGVKYCGSSFIPSPLDAVGTDSVWVGRLRRDPSRKNSVNLWIVSDNVRKGAALNAVQIAEASE
ncbi:hypothetical protein AMJ40_04105 [candidate division TA06 bacterium DG_26]|uniref:Aspartate-semialdehyde dehydrogenase n=1 Tax=candidate division TA06 bacterium DG_26 TaxID=1703771 RepID=A0A0S7WJ11_UNCT6|nr:MAG: hypothetical protein AMJ40_04105 [candidate division TA06 bacterium DG_26]